MAVEKQRVSWEEIERMVLDLAEQVRGEYDLMLAITRGGLVPAGLLAYKLEIRNILVAAVEFYNDDRKLGDSPTFLQFPADPLLRGQRVLVVDEVWDSGTTIMAVIDRIQQAGGEPTTAVLHYKPGNTVVEARPDHFVAETAAWILYPWAHLES